VVFHILLALSEGPLHGYAVMKQVEDASGVVMGPGTIYGALQRLGEAGWVAEEAGAPEDSRRGRAFTLTPEGLEALRREAVRITGLANLEAVRTLAPEGGRA
jgi:DNA-binding PadR family transcriptional regulator